MQKAALPDMSPLVYAHPRLKNCRKPAVILDLIMNGTGESVRDESVLPHYYTNVYLHHKSPVFDYWKAAPVIPLALGLPKFGRMDLNHSRADVRPGRHAHQFTNPHCNSFTDLPAGAFGLFFFIRAVLFRKFKFK